jgi:hypothetical protein
MIERAIREPLGADMLKRILRRFRPTPSMAVSLLGLVVALGSAGYAANGTEFIFGVINSATQRPSSVPTNAL